MFEGATKRLSLLGGGLLGSRLLSCGLLGSRLLGSRLLSSLLGGGLLSGLLGSRLLSGLLGGGLLSGLLDGGLLSLRLLGLGLLDLLSLISELVAASSLARGLSHLQHTSGDFTLQGHTQMDGGLSSINLVVGTDVLQDSLTAAASSVLKSLKGSGYHNRVFGVGSRCLGLGGLNDLLGGSSGSGSHFEFVVCRKSN